MKLTKHHKRAGVSAGVIALLIPIGNRALDSVQKIVEARVAVSEVKAKDDSDFKDAVMADMLDRIATLEAEMKAVKK